VLVPGACEGFLYEERLGLPRAGHGRFQPAPMALPQGMAQPCSHHGGAWGDLV